MKKFDCVHRSRQILSSISYQGLKLSDTHDFCYVMGKQIPGKKGCSTTCKGYASRYIDRDDPRYEEAFKELSDLLTWKISLPINNLEELDKITEQALEKGQDNADIRRENQKN